MDPFARKMWRAGIGFAASLLLLVGGLKLYSMHQWPTCPDKVLMEFASPDKRWVADILQRRCSEYSPFSTRVNLRPAGPLQRGFFSGQVKQGTVFVMEQDALGAGLNLLWSGPNLLTVRCVHCAPALLHQPDEKWESVTIHYELH